MPLGWPFGYVVAHGRNHPKKNRGAEAPRPVMQNSTSVLL
jgi:hypothetical protein